MPELDHHPEDESHYDCEFCRDTGKLDGSEYYDCGHCHVAAERVQLERMVRALGGMSIEDIAYKVQQTAKRTAYAVAAAEMVLLRDKAAQAERRTFELSEKLAATAPVAEPVTLSDEDIIRIANIHYRPDMTSDEFQKTAGGFLAAVRALLAASQGASHG